MSSGGARTNGKAAEIDLALRLILVPLPQTMGNSWDIVSSVALSSHVKVVLPQLRMCLQELENKVQHIVSHP